jgi:hypothetical protein
MGCGSLPIGLESRPEALGPYPLALLLEELGCSETAALAGGRVDCYPDAPALKAVRRPLHSLTRDSSGRHHDGEISRRHL